MQGTDGNFHGVAAGGGEYLGGTIFEITPAGVLTKLHDFRGEPSDGYVPYGALVQGSDGNFYGTTAGGGTDESCVFGCGTVFKVTAGGNVTIIHSLSGKDGINPLGGLVQGTNGTFYGSISAGATYSDGTLFSLAVGLGPFIATQPTSGKAGSRVIILGYNLTGSTGVSFNGTPAAFSVISDTEITTAVPAGATSGTVKVTTPSGTLKSNKKFRVTQ